MNRAEKPGAPVPRTSGLMPSADDRPGHLPKGVWGWMVDHILVLTLLAGAAMAAALVLWAERLFPR